MRSIAFIPLLTALVVATPAAHAQSAQRWSLQASGLFVGTMGEAYEGLSSGIGLEAQLRLTPGVWSFGGGVQVSSHSVNLGDFGNDDVMLAGVFFEPRRVFDLGSTSYAPYLSGRISFLKQSLDTEVNGTAITASASGTQINAGGGMLIRMSPRVNLDVGATFGLIRFGDVELDVPGVGSGVVEGSSGNGQNLVMRVGVAIGLGK